MTINLVPPIWVDIRELIWSHSDYITIPEVKLVNGKGQRAFSTMPGVP